MSQTNLSMQAIKRLPLYLAYLKSLPNEFETVSATVIAKAMGLGQVQVRKDLAAVCSQGKPKIGYETAVLIRSLEESLGYNNLENAIIVGAGRLGKALMNYSGFQSYGLHIFAAFDKNSSPTSKEKSGCPIFSADKLEDLCARFQVHVGIITVPAEEAQDVCDRLIACGIRAIWNFAPTHLRVPRDVLVQNENMAASLAVLFHHLRQRQTAVTKSAAVD